MIIHRPLKIKVSEEELNEIREQNNKSKKITKKTTSPQTNYKIITTHP
jgi:hypothetical protein